MDVGLPQGLDQVCIIGNPWTTDHSLSYEPVSHALRAPSAADDVLDGCARASGGIEMASESSGMGASCLLLLYAALVPVLPEISGVQCISNRLRRIPACGPSFFCSRATSPTRRSHRSPAAAYRTRSCLVWSIRARGWCGFTSERWRRVPHCGTGEATSQDRSWSSLCRVRQRGGPRMDAGPVH